LGPENLRSVFLCNSGAEANENALTLARLATGRRKVVSLTGGFHGRTLLTLSLSAWPAIVAGRRRGGTAGGRCGDRAFRRPARAEQVIDQSCAAVIIEPVQGLGGCLPAPADYLRGLRRLCDRCGALLIFDEVQCGSGRCGAFTVAQLRNVAPNLLTLAKGLGGGFPIGAVLIDESTARVVRPGDLGTTFGGGPLACAAALANLQAMFDEGMIDNAARLGAWLNTSRPAFPAYSKSRARA
jgi:acetylornithine/succinyldiaminopimelate/putrescine aminotransferase